MRYLRNFNESSSGKSEKREIISYIKDVLLELDDDSYITNVSMPFGSPIVSIKNKLESGHSAVKLSDILPTMQHIISYMNEVGYSKYTISFQPLWWDKGHLRRIMCKIEDLNIDDTYGEFRITFEK